MKEHLVSFAKGINQVSDKALLDPGFVTCMDNIDIRSGSMRTIPGLLEVKVPPLGVPMNHYSCNGEDANYLYASNGLFILSSQKRSYTSETLGSSDRVYFTEYGSTAMKIVNGAQTPLGVRRPTAPLGIKQASSLGISNFVVTEMAGGNIKKETTKSYRIALATDEGVTPPTSKISVKAVGDLVSFRLSWNRSIISDQTITEVVIFSGDDDKERRVASVPPGQTYYVDDGSVSGAAGEAASSYEIPYDLQYCYTFVRNVRGMEDESGPSPLSQPMGSGAARAVSFQDMVDGFLDSDNVVSAVGIAGVTPISNAVKNMVRFKVLAAGMDATLAMSYIDIGKEDETQPMQFALLNGDHIRFTVDAGLGVGAYQIKLADDSDLPHERMEAGGDWRLTSRIWFEDAAVALATPGSYLERHIQESLSGVSVSSNGADIVFSTAEDHCFYTGQKVTFPGSTLWTGQYEVVVSPVTRKEFFIRGGPSDRTVASFGYGDTVLAHMALITVPGQSYKTFPHSEDAIYLSLTPDVGSSPSAQPILGWRRARVGSGVVTVGQFVVDEVTPSGFVSTLGLNTMIYIPNNDYIVCRRLYRIGDTGEFLRVKDIPLWESSYTDVRPNTALYDILPSNYTDNGIEVVFDPPPMGMTGLISHYDMKAGIHGNSVRWTPNGYPDAWPEECSQDFKYAPLAIRSWEQGILVFCEDAIYMLVGNMATSMSVSGTEAVDGCIAPDSVQVTSIGVFYLSRRGLMLYRGGRADCITDTRIFPNTILGTSRFTGDQELTRKPYYFFISRHSYLYRALAAKDVDVLTLPGDPLSIDTTEPSSAIIHEIRSFYHDGKYYMYWADQDSAFPNDTPYDSQWLKHNNFECHTMLCVDTYSNGMPITTLGLKPRDVFVTEKEEALFLVSGAGLDLAGAIAPPLPVTTVTISVTVP